MSDRWMLRFSGTYQAQKVHYANNGNIFGGSYQNPAIIGLLNGQWWASDSTGNLGSDWSWKASGAYIFPYDITVGVYFKYQNGYVVPIIGGGRFLFGYAEGQHRQLVAPPDTVRLPDVIYSDMQIEKSFNLPKYGALHFSATIFNLFNINTIQAENGRVGSFQFLEPTQIVNPRVFRLGLRYSF